MDGAGSWLKVRVGLLRLFEGGVLCEFVRWRFCAGRGVGESSSVGVQ